MNCPIAIFSFVAVAFNRFKPSLLQQGLKRFDVENIDVGFVVIGILEGDANNEMTIFLEQKVHLLGRVDGLVDVFQGVKTDGRIKFLLATNLPQVLDLESDSLGRFDEIVLDVVPNHFFDFWLLNQNSGDESLPATEVSHLPEQV